MFECNYVFTVRYLKEIFVSEFAKIGPAARLFLLASAFLLINAAPARSASEEEAIVAPPGTSMETLKKFNDGYALLNSGKLTQATDIYAAICKEAPNFAEAHLMQGVALMKQNRAVEAEKELVKADTLKPDMALGLIDLGSVYQMQGRYQDALAKFNRYLQLFPKGKHVVQVTGLVNALKTEQQRNQGATSSAGLDNYLSEATAIGAARWRTDDMPLKVYITSGAGIKEYRNEYLAIIKQSFADWAAASAGKLSIEYSSNPDDASIICTWVDDPKQVINPAEGGQAVVTPDTNGILGRTKIKILTQNPGLSEKITEGTVRHICLHEIGHALGLLGHSSQPTDIMFAAVNFAAPQPGLSDRDKNTLLKLYDAPDSFLAEHRMKTGEGAMSGSEGNPTNQALRLNADGLKEAQAGHYQQALKIFEQALKIDPDSDFVKLNMASCYGEMGRSDFNSGNMSGAEKNMLRAAEGFEKCGRKDNAAAAYRNLVQMARVQGHLADVQKYELKARSLHK
jgi:tetratricopeptide (TPR) repeat protein